ELIEGSYAMPVAGSEMTQLWPIRGYDAVAREQLDMANLLYAKVSFDQATGRLTMPQMTVACISYASPKPPPKEEVARRAQELVSAWKS
ncbi:MAG: hypothetical protein QOF78_1818, partial [Phycisphaerales bacterium]|nr:hypothetical protein [Phycisphaerales bacterium]